MQIFIGYDKREDAAYQVCQSSIRRHASGPVEISPITIEEMRRRGLFTRGFEPLASTDFAFTRFLVPKLMEYEGWALFCDCDFLFRADVAELFAMADDRYAVMCVQHDQVPRETKKMDGKKQVAYPRKNWSSLVLWNCGHPANLKCDAELVNSETGAFLHRFGWLEDELIGALPLAWNYLSGYTSDWVVPKAVHYTLGGPWFEDYQHVPYAKEWTDLAAESGLVEAR